MLTLYFQQFSTRGQNMDLFRLPVELLGKRGDRLDHMLTAIENDKDLSRTNKVDQLQAVSRPGSSDLSATPRDVATAPAT